MERPQINEEIIHDFSRKLRQKSAIDFFKAYVNWQRNYRSGNLNLNDSTTFPQFGPLSINLDLTTACNFRCSFCVDMKILNNGKPFSLSQIFKTMDTLCNHGLKSVLLIGGGEPTLYHGFASVVHYLKEKKLQVGVVTNGAALNRIIEVSDFLGDGDWIRVSLDAATDKTYQLIHRPRVKISLQDICNKVAELKRFNKSLLIGCSYIIMWEGTKFNNTNSLDNIDEIPEAVALTLDSGFDYISFKPCLLKLESSDIESLLHCETDDFRRFIAKRINDNLEKAKGIANKKIQVVTTLNLQAILNGAHTLQQFKLQPQHCHIQLFRQIVSPLGIFHCPAYRGSVKTHIGEATDYMDEDSFLKTVIRNYHNMLNFNAVETCKDIICFYNQVNNWIEEFIKSNKSLTSIETCEDHNFFI